MDLEQFESLLLGNNIKQKSVGKADLENKTIKSNLCTRQKNILS
jgi:hypothetical protein